jgi:hypothetical protein
MTTPALDAPSRRWQRHESRAVRPFRSADECLVDVALRLYPDKEFDTADHVRLDVERDRLAVAVRVPAPPPDLAQLLGLPPASLSIAISVEDGVFKHSEVAWAVPITEFGSDPRTVNIERDLTDRLSWRGETRVHVAVVLREDRSGAVGTARRVGSWLARKTFVVGRTRDLASFAIEPVEPAYFTSRGLPSATTYLVEILDADLNQKCDTISDLVKVKLAKDVHAALARDEDSSVSKALVRTIFVDVATTILATGYAALTSPLDPEGILAVVTDRIAKRAGLASARIEALAKESAGASLRAILQAEAELSQALVAAARRG